MNEYLPLVSLWRLLAVLALVISPHVLRLPVWETALIAAVIGWRALAAYKQWRLPPVWLKLGLTALAFIGDVIGIMGGFAVGVTRLGFNPSTYINTTWTYLTNDDVASGLIKAAVFGFIIALMGCWHGYNSGRGAQGVGKATTNAVVSASVLILAANFILTGLFFAE